MAHFTDTPSHGYLYLTASEQRSIPEYARRFSYEEDCEWSIPVVALPTLANQTSVFGPDPVKTVQHARESCRNYYPDIFERLTGEKPTPENSIVLADEKFYRDNKDRYIGVCASGDWKDGVPAGYVEVLATMGGARDHTATVRFLVKAEDYHSRGSFGYVIPKTMIPSP